MAGIHTSNITSAANNGDVTIDPNGTGKTKIKSVDSTNPGQTPVCTTSDGTLIRMDLDSLTDIGDLAEGDEDWMLIQDTSDSKKLKKIAVSEVLGGGGIGQALPNPDQITSVPPFEGGDGSASNPYLLTPITVPIPGGNGEAPQVITIDMGAGSAGNIVISEVTSGITSKFNQIPFVLDAVGRGTFQFKYSDEPPTSPGNGQVYNATFQIGNTYFRWAGVNQISNKSTWGPVTSPNASPLSVYYAGEALYGTINTNWEDGNGTLSASGGIVFSVNNGTVNGNDKSVSNGNVVKVGYDEATCNAAANGAKISGVLSKSGFLQEFSFFKSVNANAYTYPQKTNVPPSSQQQSGLTTLRGINCKSTLTAGSSTMSSVQVSIDGGTYRSLPTDITPGQSLQIRGTCGAGAGASYLAQVMCGTGAINFIATTTSVGQAVTKPVITAPSRGAHVPSGNLTHTSTAYDCTSSTAAHANSDWQLYTSTVNQHPKTSAIESVQLPQNPQLKYFVPSASGPPNEGAFANVVEIGGTVIMAAAESGRSMYALTPTASSWEDWNSLGGGVAEIDQKGVAFGNNFILSADTQHTRCRGARFDDIDALGYPNTPISITCEFDKSAPGRVWVYDNSSNKWGFITSGDASQTIQLERFIYREQTNLLTSDTHCAIVAPGYSLLWDTVRYDRLYNRWLCNDNSGSIYELPGTMWTADTQEAQRIGSAAFGTDVQIERYCSVPGGVVVGATSGRLGHISNSGQWTEIRGAVLDVLDKCRFLVYNAGIVVAAWGNSFDSTSGGTVQWFFSKNDASLGFGSNQSAYTGSNYNFVDCFPVSRGFLAYHSQEGWMYLEGQTQKLIFEDASGLEHFSKGDVATCVERPSIQSYVVDVDINARSMEVTYDPNVVNWSVRKHATNLSVEFPVAPDSDTPNSDYSLVRQSMASSADKTSFAATGLSAGYYFVHCRHRSSDGPPVESAWSDWSSYQIDP